VELVVLDRSFGADDDPPAESEPDQDPAPDQDADADVASIREAVSEMDSLTVEERRFLAGYAYILVRVARADGVINDAEIRVIEQAVIEAGRLLERQGVLLVALASRMNSLYGATEDYAFTREFARLSTPQQLQRLLRACVAVGAADGPITSAESTELYEIGRELRFTAEDVDAIRDQIDPRPPAAPVAPGQ
jgi:uncharacterized membrane protein YebE (DUF533 family)